MRHTNFQGLLQEKIANIESKTNLEGHIQKYLKKLKKLLQYTQQKSHDNKMLSEIILIQYFFSILIEFLTIKTNADSFFLVPDRDDRINFKDNIIVDLINENSHNLINERQKLKILGFGLEHNNQFQFDELVRVPDFFTGIVAATDFTEISVDKPNHLDFLVNCIADNPRVFIAEFDCEKYQYKIYTVNKKENVICAPFYRGTEDLLNLQK